MTRLVGVFLEQATHCEHLGSRFMARLLRLLANHWPIDTALTHDYKRGSAILVLTAPLYHCD